ncbi:MAG TPA: MJ0042-type zinc finger domain-containing protein [Tepidisphaeraceae bacterium]|jgi:predicted Zn finger-like uncharacterized protein|nr:MJ0042-type zinc finger domain-containing protein [Tepidisphaeraceae bacterium]
MAISVQCDNCRHSYKVDEKLVGQRVKCKHCGSAFLIEAPPPPDDPFAEGAFDAAVEEKPAERPERVYSNPIASGALKPAAAPKPAPPAASTGQFVGAARSARVSHTNLPINKLTWLVLGLLAVVSLGVGIYLSSQAFSQVKDSHAAMMVTAKIWGWIVLFDAMVFAVLGPLLLLGVWGAATVLNERLTRSAYLRACATAAVAVIIACMAEFSPDLLKITLFVLILPALYYVVKIAFDFDWGAGAVALAFGAGGLLVGAFILKLVLGLIMAGTIFTAVNTARDLALASPPPSTSDDTSWNTTADGKPGPAVTPTRDPAAYARFKEEVQTKTTADISQSTREEHMPDVIELKRGLASLQAAFHDQPDWDDTARRVDVFAQAVAALPSGKFDNSIYTDSPDADEWTTGQLSRGRLSPEVSFGQFKLQPPSDMKLDLHAVEEKPGVLTWASSTHAGASLSIFTMPRNNARQRKPAISDKPAVLHAAAEKGLLAINGANMNASEGQINGMTTTRLVETAGERATQYYIPAGDKWIVIQVHPAADPFYAKVVNAAARTIREIDPGESLSDPLSPVFIAPRLMDDYDRAAAILKKAGPAGEDAVDGLLSSEDPATRQTALKYLAENATIRSAQALRKATLSSDLGTADMARNVIAHIQSVAATQPADATAPTTAPVVVDPSKTGDLPAVLADLNGTDPAARKSAVLALHAIPPTEKDRHAVSTKLAALLRAGDKSVPGNDLIAALSVWGDSSIGLELGPLLKEDADPELRHAAIQILGALKDVKSAAAIAKWLKTDPAPTVTALMAMGSGAEFAVTPSLRDSSAIVQIDAARILERIGTKKSLADLTRAVKEDKDAAAKQSAQVAIDSIKSRMSAEETPAPGRVPKR